MAQNFTLPGDQGYTLTLPHGKALALILSIFTVGTLVCIASALAAFIGAVYLAILAVHATSQLAMQFSALYSGCDAFGRLVIWLVALILLLKVSPFVVRSVRRSLTSILAK